MVQQQKPNGTQKQRLVANNLNLDILRQHDLKSNPLYEMTYRELVKKILDLKSVKA